MAKNNSQPINDVLEDNSIISNKTLFDFLARAAIREHFSSSWSSNEIINEREYIVLLENQSVTEMRDSFGNDDTSLLVNFSLRLKVIYYLYRFITEMDNQKEVLDMSNYLTKCWLCDFSYTDFAPCRRVFIEKCGHPICEYCSMTKRDKNCQLCDGSFVKPSELVDDSHYFNGSLTPPTCLEVPLHHNSLNLDECMSLPYPQEVNNLLNLFGTKILWPGQGSIMNTFFRKNHGVFQVSQSCSGKSLLAHIHALSSNKITVLILPYVSEIEHLQEVTDNLLPKKHLHFI